MSAETLFTAARRAHRDFQIDMNKGGLMSVQTQQSMETLGKELERERTRLKAIGDPSVVGERA